MNYFFSGLLAITGFITFAISSKFLFSKKYFSYHQEATKLKWEEINESRRLLILAIMKMAGFGIIGVAMLMIFYSVYSFFDKSFILKYIVLAVSLLFWTGSFAVTFSVHKKTNANTPWKGSLLCVVLIIATFVISLF